MRRGRSRRRLVIVVLVAFWLLGAPTPTPVGADPVSDAKAQVAAAQDKIDELDERASVLEANLQDDEALLDQTTVAVAESAAKVKELEGKLAELQAAISDLAVTTFMAGDQVSGDVGMLTGASAAAEIVEREEYVRIAINAGASSVDDLDATATDLEQERNALEAQRKDVEGLVSSVKKKTAANEKAEKEAAVYYETAQAKYGQALVDEQRRREQEAIAKAAREAAEASARLAASQAAAARASKKHAAETHSAPPPAPGAAGAVAAAESQVGVSYVFATARPGVSFDCSGLTMWAWGRSGVSLPHLARGQYASLPHVAPEDIEPGDLLFFYSPISHVGMYVGDGMMVDAANPRVGVRKKAVDWSSVAGIGRPG